MRLRALLCSCAVLVAISVISPARANGWEHWGVPLAALLGALTGDQAEHQIASARSLGHRREATAVAPMLELVARSGTPAPVVSAVIEALGRIGDRRALPRLHDLLRSSPREELRADAAAALGAIGAPESLPELMAALSREPSLIGRAAVVSALGAWRDPAAIATLAALLDEPRHRPLRPRAILSLGRMGPQAADPLLAALRATGSDSERREIVDALGRAGSPEAVGPLAMLATSSPSPELRAHVAVALGALRDGSAVPTLIGLLNDDATAVRYYAVRGLGEAGDARAAEPLRALYRRLAATHTTDSPGTIPFPSAEPLLDLSLQVEITTTLIDLDAPGSLALFANALGAREYPRYSAVGLRLNQEIYELRRAATVGLGYSGATEAEPLLIEGPLRDRDPRLRAAAVRSLGVLGTALGRSTLDALLPRLNDESPEVRWETAFVLGRVDNAGAVPHLVERLADPHAEVRRQSALSLGMLRDSAAREALTALAAGDPDERTRTAAAVALTALGAR